MPPTLEQVLNALNNGTEKVAAQNKSWFESEFVQMVEVLKTSKTNILFLYSCEINDKCLQMLSLALKKNPSLKVLYLSYNHITHDGINFLSIALEENNSLTKLDLSNNKIGYNGVKFLSVGLQKNNSLTHLDLSANNVGNNEMNTLSIALEKNKSLTHLASSNNEIGDIGINVLSVGLVKNNFLRTLVLVSNKIGDIGAKSLCIVPKTTNLEINIGFNAISESQKNELDKIIQIKKTQWYKLMITLSSVRIISRIGIKSAFRCLPNELIRKLTMYQL